MNARLARSNLEATLDRLATEPGTSAEQMNRLNAMLASSHRFVHAVMALEAGWWQTPAVKPRPEFLVFAAEVEKTLSLLAATLHGSQVSHKEFPNLRKSHNQLLQAGEPHTERYTLANIEADRITNSLNTLREQIVKWTHSSQNNQPSEQSQAQENDSSSSK
jgi:hypothetical protein